MFQGSIYLLSVQQGEQFSVLFPKENRSFFPVLLSILFSRNLQPDLLSQISIFRKHPALKVIRKTTAHFFLCLKLILHHQFSWQCNWWHVLSYQWLLLFLWRASRSRKSFPNGQKFPQGLQTHPQQCDNQSLPGC